MSAWHLLLNRYRTRRMVVGSVDPLPDGWTEVATYDAPSFSDALVIGRYLAPWVMATRRYADPRDAA